MEWKYILYALLMCLISTLVVTISGIIYTGYSNSRNNQRWCQVLIAIDDAYEQVRSNPNASSAGLRIAKEFHTLRVDFGC